MLETRGLSRTFGDTVAVDSIDLTVPDGLMTGFVGGNGAGKTTTMRMLMGVLATSAGDIIWQGRPITTLDRRGFGYMPEERGLYPRQPILDQLIYLAGLRGMTAPAARAAILDLLDRFGLADRRKDKLDSLSLGNQQRVQIIAAVVPTPEMLVLDEPFSGLDPAAVDSMADLLAGYTRTGVGVLFSSHQLDLVERLCDRLVILAHGRIVASGGVEELRETGPVRFRLVTASDAGWVRDQAGIQALDVAGPSALFEVPREAPGPEQGVLAEAVRRGAVHEFSRVRPALSDIYREATA